MHDHISYAVNFLSCLNKCFYYYYYYYAQLLFLSVSWFHISFERHNNTVNMAAERKGLRLEKGFYKVVEDGVPLERANYPSSH